ncbi:uncharacterized protein LOC141686025 [Apium graveolens]|uniref:uncharacterized protein LOC141686025 n=1 Tax=Apium graveolens TaxID=4045 RepID=UPI003D79C015
MSEHTAKHMTWHKNREIKEGELSHPSDGDDWKNFDKRYPSFAKEFRNVRLGLSSDGFNPFGNSGNNVYTLWPVVVVVYNLPPSMCMKRPFMFMTLLIPGPDNPKKNLNVFLRPLMNELFILWQSGVETYDQHLKTNFIMKAALMWTISDFPALGMLSGWSTKGKMGCPVCVGNVQGFQLKNCGKCCFYGTYRTFLDKNDPMRKKNQKYATTELKVFDGRTKGEKLLSSLLQIDFAPPGNTFSKFKPRGYGVDHHWTHFSMFWELPYWASHDLRHCIDVMHTEKNVFENIFYTIVNDRIKTKDKKKSRADCKYLDVRRDLWIDEKGIMPKAPYTITRTQLRLLCDWISKLKLPDGCVSNISRCIKWDTLRITGFKSHDCHIFMQKLMPIAFREFLPSYIVEALAALSNIFLDICSSVLLREDLDVLEKHVVRTMCVLETVFPPALFDIMEHLLVHLIEECRLGGPVYYRWMYPFERLLKHMKDKVGNRARVEGSIAERYVEEEMINFSSFYFRSSINTVHNTARRNEVVVEAQEENVLEVFRYPLQTIGKHVVGYLNKSDLMIAEYYVLLNMPEVQPYIREFDAHIRANDPHISNERLESVQKTKFKPWFREKVENGVNYDLFKYLIDGPVCDIFSFQGCLVNRYKFHVNDGVFVKGTFHNDVLVNYYGQIEEIIKLIYGGGNFVYLFRCHWFDSVGNGVRVDKNRVVTIDVKSRLKSNEIFILASQAIQVYYAPGVLNPRSNLYTVVNCKNRPIDETTNEPNEEAFQENVSNASSSSFFIDFAQYDPIRIDRTQNMEEEEEEDEELQEDEEV